MKEAELQFGKRRLKVLLLLMQHAELDDQTFEGQVILHFSASGAVKGAVQPAPREIAA